MKFVFRFAEELVKVWTADVVRELSGGMPKVWILIITTLPCKSGHAE